MHRLSWGWFEGEWSPWAHIVKCLGPQLAGLFWVAPGVVEAGFEVSKATPFLVSSLLMLVDQDVHSQLLLQHRACLLAAMLPAVMSSLVMAWAIWSRDPPVTDRLLKKDCTSNH